MADEHCIGINIEDAAVRRAFDVGEVAFIGVMQQELNGLVRDRQRDLARMFPYGVPSLSRRARLKYRLRTMQHGARERVAVCIAPWLDDSGW